MKSPDFSGLPFVDSIRLKLHCSLVILRRDRRYLIKTMLNELRGCWRLSLVILYTVVDDDHLCQTIHFCFSSNGYKC